MLDKDAITEILETYKKYGWVLRRLILTEASKTALGDDVKELAGGVPVVTSDIDAAWFSRQPKAGPNAWEVRHLSSNPYALLEQIDENSSDLEETLSSVETRLRAAVRRDS